MEESAGGIKRAKPILFRKAAVAYFDECAHWSDAYREINTLKLSHLLPAFGELLLTDITPASIARYQRDRRLAGASGREINMETAVLRMILHKHRLWHLLAPDFASCQNEKISDVHFPWRKPIGSSKPLPRAGAVPWPKTLSTALHLADDEPLRLQQQGIAERRRTPSSSNGLQGLRRNGPQRAQISAGSNGFIAGSQISVPTS